MRNIQQPKLGLPSTFNAQRPTSAPMGSTWTLKVEGWVLNVFLSSILALCFLPLATDAQLQTIPLGGTASRLSSVTYYDPPNEQQVKVRLSGNEMTPLPGALFDVKKLTIERYDLGGKLEAVVRAPECVYAQLDGVASSPGHLEVELAGGKVHIEGDGFMWQQRDQLLVISNHVHTIIKTGFWNLTKQ